VKAMLFRGLYNLKIMILEQLGQLAERLGNKARLDGITIRMDNPLIRMDIKGEIMLGWYEFLERQLIQKYLPKDEPVIELGASIGVVACEVNRTLALPHQHVVVEANCDLIPTLEKNRDMNHCQFDIMEGAIGYGSAYILFFSNEGSLTGSVYRGSGKTMKVQALTLQSIAEKAQFSYFNLICDIEGSELDLVDHEIDYLYDHVGWILMEVHHFAPGGKREMNEAIKKLQNKGFDIVRNFYIYYCLRNRNHKNRDAKDHLP
jgi:FkbM family methyltransferase